MFTGIIAADGTMTVMYDGQVYVASKSHHNYKQLRESFKKRHASVFVKLYKETEPGVRITNNSIFINGSELKTFAAKRYFELRESGFTVDPLFKFLENCSKNPDTKSIEELYDFLERNQVPLTDDGCFMAWKVTRSDGYDKHSGRIKYEVGKTVSIPRNLVDSNRERECSYGLHVGGLTYSGPEGCFYNQGDNVFIVKVNPKDVVSVPLDCNASKIRVCSMDVVSEYKPMNMVKVEEHEIRFQLGVRYEITCNNNDKYQLHVIRVYNDRVFGRMKGKYMVIDYNRIKDVE